MSKYILALKNADGELRYVTEYESSVLYWGEDIKRAKVFQRIGDVKAWYEKNHSDLRISLIVFSENEEIEATKAKKRFESGAEWCEIFQDIIETVQPQKETAKTTTVSYVVKRKFKSKWFYVCLEKKVISTESDRPYYKTKTEYVYSINIKEALRVENIASAYGLIEKMIYLMCKRPRNETLSLNDFEIEAVYETAQTYEEDMKPQEQLDEKGTVSQGTIKPLAEEEKIFQQGMKMQKELDKLEVEKGMKQMAQILLNLIENGKGEKK